MNRTIANQRLSALAQTGRYVFTLRDLETVFHDSSSRAVRAGIQRLVKTGILQRAIKGVYVYILGPVTGGSVLELIAKALRRGEYNYISLESALSEYGIISQIPIDRITVMTTGRKGEYHTPYGVIEFTHTKRSVSDIIKNLQETDQPLRRATAHAALRDLKRVGRNLHLVLDEGELDEN